ncbi:MAG TPA: vitamin K epoxide reductase family protein [Dongiaceae bacterium]|nr:vitamin K epoxide reductase family protein [Dongiaceae bacterium]
MTDEILVKRAGATSLVAARGFLLLALAGAGYLATLSLTGGGIGGCGPGSGCHHVLGTRWAYWLGVPVSLPAFGLYCAMLAATFAVANPRLRQREPLWWQFIAGASLAVVGAGLWFVLLQYAVIGSWCKFCLATHASAATAAVLLLLALSKRRSADAGRMPAPLSWRGLRFSAVGAVLVLGTLVIGQMAVSKRLYALNRIDAARGLSRELKLHGGKFRLDPDEVPRLGSASATNFIVSLFDYTCIHCRALHPLLVGAEHQYAGQLAILSLPMPLDAACNPLIPITRPANANACEYAKLSLAVWRAKREAFREFDDWLFGLNAAPSLDQVRAKAEALAGKAALAGALRDEWVQRQLRLDISLYQANAIATSDARLPQLIIGDAIAHGSIASAEELAQLIVQHTPLGRAKTESRSQKAEIQQRVEAQGH